MVKSALDLAGDDAVEGGDGLLLVTQDQPPGVGASELGGSPYSLLVEAVEIEVDPLRPRSAPGRRRAPPPGGGSIRW